MTALMLGSVAITLVICGDASLPDVKTGEVVGHLEAPRGRTLTARITTYVWTGNRTATGTWPHFGTVAVDPHVIPLGSRLRIEGFPGVTLVAEDRGGGVIGNHVDVFLDSYADAIRFGSQYRQVTVLE